MTEAQYRELERFPGYRVGDDGTVWTRWEKRGAAKGQVRIGERWREMATSILRGYRVVGLVRKDGVRLSMKVHRLVLEAFVGPCPPGMECRHLDGNRGNCLLSNLAWGTKLENEADKILHRTVTCGERHGSSKLCTADVIQIRKRVSLGESRARVALDFGVNAGTVARVAARETWKHVDIGGEGGAE